ncbi:unnamed protein product (macronuclear) [Paramecium tetraurelia]|uniref:HTH psq-type domain-containing protein n=1 Tax=Paramecium tetraurelia TaxID=5888 RepID=A0DCK6_PARTE|nr:uncharacterized protein GSPATT00015651001 [Paramecium tetraurelia]CAK80773.1 unnamed protein product [Paramecium tetraurelia]|eukprot:XP_001448170.1 hypothetical protein (macronuclear) [Paramecium tetraurelia strain d4-2]
MDQPRHVFKRVKERSIMDAKQSVDEWRKLFKNGETDQNGNKIKYSLKQAAEKVGVPKKTLEDYHQLLKKAEQFLDLNEVGNQKMGYLRGFLKCKQQQQTGSDILSGKDQNIDSSDYMEEEDEFKQQQQQQQFHYEEMIVEGDVRCYYMEDQSDFIQQHVQTVVIHHQLNYDNKLDIPYGDCDDCDDFDDCETDDEFDNE